ncbi:hypothetical protein [uncultured Croceitalea sp.]|uniref:hypothetical protein n=1 Tax=uncultured Croceitalea sp. TaxID=1798908 RepID=UPI00374E24CF
MKNSILLLLVILIYSCASKPRYTNSYKKIQVPSTAIGDATGKLKVTFDSKKTKKAKSKEKKKSIFDLSELGQFKLISEYGKKIKEPKKLRENLVQTLEKEAKKAKEVVNKNYVTTYRKLEFFIHDEWAQKSSANRIESLQIRISLNSDDVRFKNFMGFQNKYEVLDLGSISNTEIRSFSLGASVGSNSSSGSGIFDQSGNQTGSSGSSFTPSIEGSISNSSTLVENIALRKRVISQSGSISSKDMSIYMEGSPYKNLNGPISIDVEMEVDENALVSKEYCTFAIKNKKEILTLRKVLLPSFGKVPTVDISLNWVYRKTVRKGNTYFEGDDVIEYYQLEKKFYDDKAIFTVQDVTPKLFNFFLDKTNTKRLLAEKNGVRYVVRFLTRDEAIIFREHLLGKKDTKIGDFQLYNEKTKAPLKLSEIKDVKMLPSY